LQANQALTQASSVAIGNNRITASISGRIGAISVHVGSLAQPSSTTPMVTISQLHPIAVSFSVPERELANIVATYPKGDAPVTAQLPGAGEMQGKLIFIDNAADAQSGTIRMKAQFDNQDRKLWPGSFVNVRLVSRTIPDAVAIPAQAVVTGPVEKFVYLVQPDSTVKQQKVEVVAIEQGLAAVTGLAAGARVVVEGASNLRPGGKVRDAEASPAQAAADGERKSKRAP
jgi:RND family efflux transporter MFP subunit